MEPEKADLRQTGLFIKNNWQQFMSAWVQPELAINERLFALNSGKSGVFGFEEIPFKKSISEVLDFSEKLCFVGWPFELNTAVQQSHPESSPETISGRRPSFFSQQKRSTGRPVEDASIKGPFPPDPGGEFSKPAEQRNGAIEPQGNNDERSVPVRTPEFDFKHENDKEGAEARIKTKNPSPQGGGGMQELAGNESFSGNDFAGRDENSEPGEKGQNGYQDLGMLAGNAMKNTDRQDGSKMKTFIANPEHTNPETPNYSNNKVISEPVFEHPEPLEIKSKPAFQPVFGQHVAETEIISEEPALLPSVKTFQSLGSWLQQNATGELSGNKIIEKKPPAALSGFSAGKSREENHPVIFETYPEANNHIDLSHSEDLSQLRYPDTKPVSGFFDNPFPFPGEISDMHDAEDLIRELTEQLNREFKRFYGP